MGRPLVAAAVLLLGSSVALASGDSDLLADLARDAFAPRRIALLVAVAEVDDHSFPPLAYAERDVERLAAALRDPDAGGFDQVDLLTGATRAEVRAALEALMRRARRQDTVLVYFTGHGMADEVDGGPPLLLLAMRDSSMGDIGGSGVRLDAIQEVLQTLPARRKVLLIDACFTDEGKRGALGGEATGGAAAEAPLLRTELPADEAHLLAAGYGRPAFELDELEGSLYTTHFVAGLLDLLADVDGDGVVTVSEAHDHAATAAVQDSDGVQVPLALYRISGREDLVLSGDPDLRSAPTLALLTTYDRRHAGLALELDGRAKGTFPRSIPVEPGAHRIQLIAASGKVVDRGSYTFRPGQVVSVEKVRATLNGGFRLAHLALGVGVVPGPGRGGESAAGPGLSLGAGQRGRGLIGRHLVVRGDLSFAAIAEPDVGTWPLFGLAVEGALRFDPHPVSMELGLRAGLELLLPPGGPATDSPALLMFVPGPHAAIGVRLHNLVALRLHYRLGITHADMALLGDPGTMMIHRPGLELEVGW
jgi:uncharacterized caspase-like protein